LQSKSSKRSAIGLFGGSFDPIHNGHIYLARQARDTVPLDRVLLIPAHVPPHKTDCKLSDSRHRIKMINLSIENISWIKTDESEINRGGISYTVDTVSAAAAAHPDSMIYFIIGSDSLIELFTWRNIKKIAQLVTFIVLARDDKKLPDSIPQLDAILDEVKLRKVVLNIPPHPVSSTMIRNLIRQGKSVANYTPQGVAEYIDRHNLYADNDR